MISSILCCSPNRSALRSDFMAANPFACSVLIKAPTRREERRLQKAITPLMTWIDPSLKLIKVTKSFQSNTGRNKYSSDPTISPPTLNTGRWIGRPTVKIPCPAVSIMLFLQENGILGSKEIQKSFDRPPWRLHHRVELINVHSPNRTLADQRFYQAQPDTPLWAVCPIDVGREHLRINIFARNFSAMIEFYRTITGVEMETSKDNFCWFLLYYQPGLEIRLSLKYIDNIDPYPLDTVSLLFEVKNLRYIKDVLGVQLKQTGPGLYSLFDPDGNIVLLHTTEKLAAVLEMTSPLQKLASIQQRSQINKDNNYNDNNCNNYNQRTYERTSIKYGLSFSQANSSHSNYSTLPKSFTYFNKNASTSNDSGLATGSDGGYIEDLTSINLSKHQPTPKDFLVLRQDINNTETSFSDMLQERRSVVTDNNKNKNNKNKMFSIKNDSGYEVDLSGIDGYTSLPRLRRKREGIAPRLYMPSTEGGSGLRRSSSNVVNFSKYVIKRDNLPGIIPEAITVSEEVFV